MSTEKLTNDEDNANWHPEEPLAKSQSKKVESEQSFRFPEKVEDNSENKRRLYKWHYKQELPEGAESKLLYQEVVPGYSTFVELGKYIEYEAITPYLIYHHTYNIEDIPYVIKQGAFLSSNERKRSGIESKGGNSPDVDEETGLSDFVFTRIATPEGLRMQKEESLYGGEAVFIFENDILDRLDWYAFNEDKYGGTDQKAFIWRVAPTELFEEQKQNFELSNEQMFRLGISLTKLKYIACGSEKSAKAIVYTLLEAGINEINGRPLEEVIVITPTKIDWFRVSQDEDASRQIIAKMIAQYPEYERWLREFESGKHLL